MSTTSTSQPTAAHTFDLPGRTTTRQARAATRASAPSRPASDRGILFIVRESDEYDLKLFWNMLQQTLRRYGSRPSVSLALSLRTTVLESSPEGDALRRELGAVPLLAGTRRIGVRFAIDGDTFLYVQSSARSIHDDHNAFTSAAVETLELCSPEKLVCGPISRLVRLKSHGERIGDTAKRLDVKVAPAEVPDGIDLSEEFGWSIWQTLTTYSDLECRSIIKRLLNGTVYRLRNNCWPRGKARVPFGYQADQKGRLTVVQTEVDTIRRLLELGADETLTLSDIVATANAEKLMFRSTAKGPALLNTWTAPENALDAFYDNVALYGTGVYDVSWTVDREVVRQVFDHRVQIDDATGKGFIPFKVQFPMPTGGFADPETLRRVAELRTRADPQRGKRTEVYPFAQLLDVTTGDRQTKLIPSDARYLLRGRDLLEDTGAGFGTYEGDLILTLDSSKFHRDFAEVCSEAIATATSLLLRADTAGGLDPDELEAAIEEGRQLVAGYDRQAALAEKSEDAERLRKRGSDAARDLNELLETKAALVHSTSASGFLDTPVVGFPSIRAALDELAVCEAGGRPRLAGAMTELVEDLAIRADSATHARWTATLRIRSGAGAAFLGPIEGRIRLVPKRGHAADRWEQIAQIVLSGEVEIDDIARELDSTPKTIRRAIVEKGTAFPAAMVDALLDAPPQMRSLVWTCHEPCADSRPRAESGDDRFAEAMRKAWNPSPFAWSNTWLHKRQSRVNRAFDLILAEGPQTLTEIRGHLSWTEPYAYELINGMYRPGAGGVALPGVLQRDVTDTTRITFRTCRGCSGQLTLLAFAPGIESGLICTSCCAESATGVPIPGWLIDAIQNSGR